MAPFAVLGRVIAAFVVPPWERLESTIPSQLPPVFDTLPDPSVIQNRPVLYRDRDELCPYSEQVWLAFESKNIDYLTVLLRNDANADDEFSVEVQWPDGVVQTDPKDILERIEVVYSGNLANGGQYPPNLYPSISKAVDSVRCNIVRFDGVFPRNTKRTKHAPYLFRERDGQVNVVPMSDLMVTLEETDEVLEEYFTGPFVCGKDVTAADLIWAPFLERYAAQLPLIYNQPELSPRSHVYEALLEWYSSMDEKVPCYSCRVMGDKISWQRILQQAVAEGKVPAVDLNPPKGNMILTDRPGLDEQKLWDEYSFGRPHLAATPTLECIAHYTRNRAAILVEATAALTGVGDVDGALREVMGALLEIQNIGKGSIGTIVSSLSGDARETADFLDSRLRVPRDMGAIPAASLRRLVDAAPKPRIRSG